MFALLLVLLATASPAGARSEDARLARAVTASLRRDPVVEADAIDVRVTQRIVSLEGETDTLLEKDRAVTRARYVRGVRAVDDRLVVAPSTRGDFAIGRDVEQALIVDPAVEAYEIRPEVKRGVVTLRGTVGSKVEKALASTSASGVAGVRAVRNELDVSMGASRTDMEIGADVRGRLDADPLVDATDVSVRVDRGEVRLLGSVGTMAERARVASDAWVDGVRDVVARELFVGASPAELRDARSGGDRIEER
jgi:osmotically-inducible protein OsmY